MNHHFYVEMRLADFLVMKEYLQNVKGGNRMIFSVWRGWPSNEDSCIVEQIVWKLLSCHGGLGWFSRGDWQCLSNTPRVRLHTAKQSLLTLMRHISRPLGQHSRLYQGAIFQVDVWNSPGSKNPEASSTVTHSHCSQTCPSCPACHSPGCPASLAGLWG